MMSEWDVSCRKTCLFLKTFTLKMQKHIEHVSFKEIKSRQV